MPKYYIKLGDLKFIIDKPNHRHGISAALKYAKNKKLTIAHKVCISEKGFLVFKECICYDTKDYLKEL